MHFLKCRLCPMQQAFDAIFLVASANEGEFITGMPNNDQITELSYKPLSGQLPGV
jgi:ssDNA-specific exonuclease RecJ